MDAMTATRSSSPLPALQEEMLNAMLLFLPLDDALSMARTSNTLRDGLHAASTYWTHVTLTEATSTMLKQLVPFAKHIRRLTCIKSTASEEAWIHFACHTKHLEVLNVAGSKHFSHVALTAFAELNSSSLVEVYADNCAYIANTSALKNCAAQLRVLSLSRCRQLTTADIVTLVQEAPKLTVLNLKGCPHISPVDVLTSATSCCPQLQTLTLGGSGRFVKDVNLHLTTAFGSTRSLSLEYLDLSCSNPFGSRSPLSNEGLEPLLRSAPMLKELSLKGHSNLTRDVFEAMPKGLTSLDLTGCTRLALDLNALGNFQALEQLTVLLCPNVDVTSVQHLQDSNANLTKVDIEARPSPVAVH
ncbi:hypothetical protein H310_00542 [Aphanomyces invadans]|uniref:F-box domain-containing protein n=1 Tax=Aphanomyces invadans TaxID=157072 RepID=A0A024UW59_9STRA|nr:hypothetical protein H310_00542 [Aphanomyces invadans]ETW10172.1 hypothetical protein H310_00542 [Aphanomyces invadans]|eukprot:XP_008861583.1 hypothetical protein H310_00542 [Aphanomyces invadans]